MPIMGTRSASSLAFLLQKRYTFSIIISINVDINNECNDIVLLMRTCLGFTCINRETDLGCKSVGVPVKIPPRRYSEIFNLSV